MFNLKGCEEVSISLANRITNVAFGTSASPHNYTDTGLFEEVLSKPIDIIDVRANGELIVQAHIDYSEGNTYTFNETGLQSNTRTLSNDTTYPLEKNNTERYNYFFDVYIVPEEALFE